MSHVNEKRRFSAVCLCDPSVLHLILLYFFLFGFYGASRLFYSF